MMRFFNNGRFPRNGSEGFDGFREFCGGIGSGIHPWGGIILMFVGLAIIGVLIYLVVKGNKTAAASTPTAPSEPVKDTEYFIRILKESYAKGQISDEEFERKVRILRENQ